MGNALLSTKKESPAPNPTVPHVRRCMPSVRTILRLHTELYPRDLRGPEELRLNIAERGHILGLEVTNHLLRHASAPITPVQLEAVSMSLGAPDNFVVTSHAENMRYNAGERDLCCYLGNSGVISTPSEEAKKVAHFILHYHTVELRVLARCLPRETCLRLSKVLESMLSNEANSSKN